ncbi:TOM70 [Mytilus coruscus]|uniref:TOM70 n=1 Tax=Mytilus coruscus TaxID=42192 RepID=A0A6J8EJK5_MYTCO|nr:TOM70 [Mytilus coruscus]
MAASSESVGSCPSSEGWSKLQIGLAVGVPVVVVGGYLLYKRSKNKKSGKEQSPNGAKKKSSTGEDKPVQDKLESQNDLEKELSPLEKAQADKNKGNKYFKGGRYDQAIHCYTEAIKVCPPEEKQDLATFYHNRAAAYEKLMNLKMVVEDCTEALKNNSKYTKCLMRRANAAEQLGDLTQALEDVTALCILEGFQNPKSLMTADRVLKQLGQSKAKETYANRKPTMPSKHFIRTYLKAFTQDPVINEAGTLDQSSVQNGETDIPDTDSPYYEALRQMNAEKYEEIIPNCTKEIDNDQPCKCMEARLLRATFYFLGGETENSLADLKLLTVEDVNKKIRVNALIKKGSILIQQGKQTDGLDCFAKAVRLDPDNADIYHHRGHVSNYDNKRSDPDNADIYHHRGHVSNYDNKRSDPDNADNVMIYIIIDNADIYHHRGHVKHRKSAEIIANSGAKIPLPQTVIDSYKNNVTMFPDNGDARALYAQALTDAGKFDEADREFEKAIKLEPDNATAMVHRGLLQLQWKQDVEEAIKIINQAIDVDNKCEYAYEVLGTLEVQRSNMEKAMDLFQKAIHLSRTESEMAHLYSLLDAAHAQLKVAKNLGITLPGPMGMGMP